MNVLQERQEIYVLVDKLVSEGLPSCKQISLNDSWTLPASRANKRGMLVWQVRTHPLPQDKKIDVFSCLFPKQTKTRRYISFYIFLVLRVCACVRFGRYKFWRGRENTVVLRSVHSSEKSDFIGYSFRDKRVIFSGFFIKHLKMSKQTKSRSTKTESFSTPTSLLQYFWIFLGGQ